MIYQIIDYLLYENERPGILYLLIFIIKLAISTLDQDLDDITSNNGNPKLSLN